MAGLHFDWFDPTVPGRRVGSTVIFLFADAAAQAPPLVVSVSVAVPLYAPGGVHVAFNVVAPGLNVPPAGVDQVPPVAEPPTDPPSAAEVPPRHIAAMAPPGLAVGKAWIAIGLVADTSAHPPDAAIVFVTV